MLDEKKLLAIQLLIEGNLSKTEIAEKCNKSRTWLYEYVINDYECKAELDRRLRDIKTLGEKEFNAKLGMAIDEYWKLIQTTQDTRTKEKALAYWIDRSLGKTATKIEVTESDKDKEIDLLGEMEAESEEEYVQ